MTWRLLGPSPLELHLILKNGHCMGSWFADVGQGTKRRYMSGDDVPSFVMCRVSNTCCFAVVFS